MAKIIRDQCAGTKTVAQHRGYLQAVLRRPHSWWKPMLIARERAKKGYVINKNTGRKNQGYECDECKLIISKDETQVDHINTVVPLEGWGDAPTFLDTDWNSFMKRLYIEDIDGYRVLCKPCHKVITKEQNATRRELKKKLKE